MLASPLRRMGPHLRGDDKPVARIERSEMRGRTNNPHYRSRISLRSIRATSGGPIIPVIIVCNPVDYRVAAAYGSAPSRDDSREVAHYTRPPYRNGGSM